MFTDGQWRWVMVEGRWHLSAGFNDTFCGRPVEYEPEEREVGDFVPSKDNRCDDCVDKATDWLGL